MTFIAHDGIMKGRFSVLPVEELVWFMPEWFDSSPIKNQAAEQQDSGLHLFNQLI